MNIANAQDAAPDGTQSMYGTAASVQSAAKPATKAIAGTAVNVLFAARSGMKGTGGTDASKKRDEGHLWDACVCKKCGAIRSYETDQDGKIRNVHDWDGCMCRKCKFTRNEGHQMPPDLLAKELAKSTARVKILTPGLNLKFQCLRCKRNVTLKGGYDYCPNCLGVVDSTLEYTDSPTIMKRVYHCTKCDYWAETTFSDSY